ncbi:hypothetical protein F0562_013343 [Nyssa sinensis]|uniref:Uncharacterized protein n=1 Tax=Nyssa sinensis TaxID=561372 RepID=A0A5J4ZPN1_9ASTE|nr:hypothetical protein F0562_013343 [Nyssa sinensis]
MSIFLSHEETKTEREGKTWQLGSITGLMDIFISDPFVYECLLYRSGLDISLLGPKFTAKLKACFRV